MMLNQIWHIIRKLLRNKYLLALTFFMIWIFIFDNNNLISRYSMIKEERQLKQDYKYYKQRIIADSVKLDELKSSPEMLEKFAREEYLMKKDNEEIFVIVEK